MSKKVLISGATGDTGRAAVKEAIALGLTVRAMVHGKDVRSEALEKLGAEVALGDLLEIDTVHTAMEGVDTAYLVWPVAPCLIHATVNFVQAAKEKGVSLVEITCFSQNGQDDADTNSASRTSMTNSGARSRCATASTAASGTETRFSTTTSLRGSTTRELLPAHHLGAGH